MRHYFDVSLNNMKFPGSLMIFSTFIRTQSTPNPNSETTQDQSVASALLAALITGIQTPWGIFPLMLCNGPCVRIIGTLKNQLFEQKLHVLRAVRLSGSNLHGPRDYFVLDVDFLFGLRNVPCSIEALG